MRVARTAAGILVAGMGVVWTLQGFGASYVPTSFMTKAPVWILIGLATTALGVWLVIRTLQGPRIP